MSIISDMELYYKRSYLGLRQEDGSVKPFYIEHIIFRSHLVNSEGEFDVDNLTRQMHVNHDLIKSGLIFVVQMYSDGRFSSPATINFDDPNIVWDLPDLGYVKLPSSGWAWLSYRPLHAAKKGFITDKLHRAMTIRNHRDIYAIFNTPPSALNPHKDLLMLQDKVFYKGYEVGNVEEGVITLTNKMSYLEKFVTESFTNHRVTCEQA